MITLVERHSARKAIIRLTDLVDRLEVSIRTGAPLQGNVGLILGQLARTDDKNGQLRAVRNLLEDTQEAYYEKLRYAAAISFSCFYEYLNPEEPPARHHEFLCDKLEAVERRDIMRMIVSMPPGHAKSTYCSHYFPTWYLGRNPNKKYIQAGHTQEFVEKEMGLRAKGIIEREEYRKVFPEIVVSNESRAAGNWAIAGKQGKYLARGVGTGISGFRANIAAVDDPYASRKDAESPATRKEVYDWFMADLTTRLLPKSPLFIVATRWHPLDLCGVLEAENSNTKGIPYTIINLPAIATGNDDPLGRAENEPLWPEFYTFEHLMNLRATLPSRDWNSLYMGSPVDEKGGTFQLSWVRRYASLPKNEADADGNATKTNVRRTTISVDCANKDTERADYTVVTVWIEDTNHQHYLADVIRRRVEFTELILMIEGAAKRWNANAILVEDKGSGTQYIQTRRTEAPAPVIAISTNNQSKEFRFDGVSPMFEGGEVFLPTTADWLPDYERELLHFPAAAHDDQVDSTSQYLAWARPKNSGKTTKLKGTNTSSGVQAANAKSAQGHRAAKKFGARRGTDLTMISTPSAPIG